MKFGCIIFLLMAGLQTNAQQIGKDYLLIVQSIDKNYTTTSYYTGDKNNQNIMKSGKKNSLYSPLFILGKMAMYGYQNIISPQLFKDCPYEVTCSNYCKIAIENKGLFKGVLIGANRLLRCNKLSMLDVGLEAINSSTNKIIDEH